MLHADTLLSAEATKDAMGGAIIPQTDAHTELRELPLVKPTHDHPDLDVPIELVLRFTSENEYEHVTWSPWKHLAEPYREAVLTAESTVGDPLNDVFSWWFPEEGNVALEGRVVKHTFETVGRKAVVLTQTVVATGQKFHLHGHIMVKYVRREIRQLHEADREAFFDAMETLYRLPTKEGNKVYGDIYKGIDFFVQMHLDGAGVKDCDHWHDDAGIMTHHIGYTLQFEQALQVVDPSIAIPYWEYTIDAAEGLDEYGESMIFDDAWFGNASPSNDLHTVDKGRWAYLPVMEEAWEYVHNAFGLLRSPWNLDSTPYVTRHNMTNGNVATSMVSCSEYSSCFSSSSMKEMNSCLNGETHGPVHILVGGEWDNPEEEFLDKTGYYESPPLVTKFLWRKGYLRTPERCGEAETCRASCPSHVYESRGMTPYDVLMDVKALHWEAANIKGLIRYNKVTEKFYVAGHEDDEAFEAAFWSKMLHAFCDPGYVGEMYTSAAPYDPLFWVIHPAAERLLGWRRMLARIEPDTYSLDETWGYKHQDVIGETGTVCDWSEVRPATLDLPTCIKQICGGHREGDLLPFQIKLKGETVKLTNAEWMDLTYPENEHVPYMYDEFSLDHCTEDGYDFGSRL